MGLKRGLRRSSGNRKLGQPQGLAESPGIGGRVGGQTLPEVCCRVDGETEETVLEDGKESGSRLPESMSGVAAGDPR